VAEEALVWREQFRAGLNGRRPTVPVGLDRPAKLEPRVPPPVFWTQIPCFLELTDRVALQNIENNEVPCKIFLDKELRDVLASAGSFRLQNGAKMTCRDDDLKEDF
jgi:hypothetical protein